MVRAELLYLEGCIYLYTDTVTVAPLSPLFEAGMFCGREHICYPYQVKAAGGLPLVRARALSTLRNGMRLLPGGYRAFRRLQSLYPTAINGAIWGGTAGHPMLAAALDALCEFADRGSELPDPSAIGPHMLQRLLSGPRPADVVVHPPEVFYPLGPEIAQHWFRTTPRPELHRVLFPQTRIVHWYSSGPVKRFVQEMDESYVRQHADTQLFSRLALPLLP